jgi:hypothetical protein
VTIRANGDMMLTIGIRARYDCIALLIMGDGLQKHDDRAKTVSLLPSLTEVVLCS